MPIRSCTDDLIAFLNELVAADRNCLTRLVERRVLCNDAILAHPTVQVADLSQKRPGEDVGLNVQVGDDHLYEVGLLGILNGFCGVIDSGPHKGSGPITAEYDDKQQVVRFYRTDRPLTKNG